MHMLDVLTNCKTPVKYWDISLVFLIKETLQSILDWEWRKTLCNQCLKCSGRHNSLLHFKQATKDSGKQVAVRKAHTVIEKRDEGQPRSQSKLMGANLRLLLR